MRLLGENNNVHVGPTNNEIVNCILKLNGCWRCVCCLLLQHSEMPFTYCNTEYSGMIFIYVFSNGNANAAAEIYRRRYQNRRHQVPAESPPNLYVVANDSIVESHV